MSSLPQMPTTRYPMLPPPAPSSDLMDHVGGLTVATKAGPSLWGIEYYTSVTNHDGLKLKIGRHHSYRYDKAEANHRRLVKYLQEVAQWI